MSSPSSDLMSTSQPNDQLIQLISPWVVPLGYQVIYIEMQTHRQKVLRLYIDFLEPADEKTIGIHDCVKVSKALDERLDQDPAIVALLPSSYELEVSSPGVDRPLRTAQDFQRFAGREVRINVFRPVTQEELGNADYQNKNPKQKNFLGTLVGLKEDKVVLAVAGKGSHKADKKSKVSKKTELTTNSVEGNFLTIPLPLISKANLEPHFDFERSDERE
jgi:ribosome maturation factor RimP